MIVAADGAFGVTFPASVRSVVYRFHDLDRLDELLDRGADDLLVELPDGDDVSDGEWVLAIFEIGAGRRATAAAARGTWFGEGVRLAFEARDYERVREFVRAARHAPSEPLVVQQVADALAAERESLAPVTIRTVSVPPTPSEAPTSSGHPTDSTKLSGGLGHGARVLLIDDDPDIRDVVGAMLEAVGLVVDTCESAEAALVRRAQADFDLLVVDWNLPGMNGLQLCRAIRQDPRTATIPVLFLSANASSRDMVEAFASGADDYVVKPFRAPELGARIFGLLRRARMVGHGPLRSTT